MNHLDESKAWSEFTALDRRILKALSKLGYTYPTLVQAKCIPLGLLGKDVLVRARTGMGKTHAFAVPLLHKLLTMKDASEEDAEPRVSAVVLVPTKELCKQIEKVITDLIYYCRNSISVVALVGEKDGSRLQKFHLKSKPDILIATPAVLVKELQANSVDLSSVKTLVVDEADLVLSFGYSDDVNAITLKMPKIFQGFLMSATLSPELEKFKKLILHNPVVIKLEEGVGQGKLRQFYLESKEADKFLILYVFVKLGLLQGKGLIFVNDVNKCYRLKLFLQQFHISAAVLNASVPLNSRMHILQEFDRGVFDLLIATDSSLDQGEAEEDSDEDTDGSKKGDDELSGDRESDGDSDDDLDIDAMVGDGEVDGAVPAVGSSDSSSDEDGDDGIDSDSSADDDDGVGDADPDTAANESSGDESEFEYMSGDEAGDAAPEKSTKKRTEPSKSDVSSSKSDSKADYGVSRGIDFNSVSFVINFDLPKTVSSYTHRIGRTARAGTSGTALSFITVSDASSSEKEKITAASDAQVLHDVRMQQPRLDAAEADSALAAMSTTTDRAFGGDEEALKQPGPLLFNLKEIDSFRYRVEDTLKAVTDSAVREFRSAELKQELLNSAKLKQFFQANPADLKVLRHEKAAAAPIAQKNHLKDVPDYLVPRSMKGVQRSSDGAARKRRKTGGSQNQRVANSRSKDPLQGADDTTTSATDVAAEDRVFTNSEASSLGLHQSTSGRKAWQQRHKKGAFNVTQAKKNSHRMKGSFIKSKAYK